MNAASASVVRDAGDARKVPSGSSEPLQAQLLPVARTRFLFDSVLWQPLAATEFLSALRERRVIDGASCSVSGFALLPRGFSRLDDPVELLYRQLDEVTVLEVSLCLSELRFELDLGGLFRRGDWST